MVNQLIPEVGMGVTIQVGSDRYAGTIIRVSESKKTIWFRHDLAQRTDKNGRSEDQSYHLEPKHKGIEERATLRHNGIWRTTGAHGSRVSLGVRNHYMDPSF